MPIERVAHVIEPRPALLPARTATRGDHWFLVSFSHEAPSWWSEHELRSLVDSFIVHGIARRV